MVEMIVTVALVAVVVAAIFPVFVVLYRLFDTWEGQAQARVTGLSAELAIARDVRAYGVVQTGTSSSTDPSPVAGLVLQAAPNPVVIGDGDEGIPPSLGLPATTFCVSYAVLAGYILERRLSYPGSLQTPFGRTVVAHGIVQFSSLQTSASSVAISLDVTAQGGGGITAAPIAVAAVRLKPDPITLTTRSPVVNALCP
jgi:type II secretory pathway component PulJ